MEGSYQPKSRTWTVEPLFSLEPVDDATAPFNLSLPQSATKTVRVLSTNSTSFTARVVGAAEDSRTTFLPVVRVLAATAAVRALLYFPCASIVVEIPCTREAHARAILTLSRRCARRTGRRQCWR
jgi:hypothetical protein